jgi:hypothetical protein
VARKIDADLYHDTARNLLSAAKGNEELTMLVEDQLKDMLETGYFDLKEEKRDSNRRKSA